VTGGPVKSLCERCAERPIEQWPSEALAEFDGIFVCLECWDELTGRVSARVGSSCPRPAATHIPANTVVIGDSEEIIMVLATILHEKFYHEIFDLQDHYPHGFFALVYTGTYIEQVPVLGSDGRPKMRQDIIGPAYEVTEGRPFTHGKVNPKQLTDMRQFVLYLTTGATARRRY
jgi:hypothetical protein